MTRVEIAEQIAAGINAFYAGPGVWAPSFREEVGPPRCTPEMVIDVANWRMAGSIGAAPHGLLGVSADSHLDERWGEYLEAAAAEGAPCGIVPPGPWVALPTSRLVGRRKPEGGFEVVCTVHGGNEHDARAMAVFIAASRDAADALADLLVLAERRIKRRDDGMPIDGHHSMMDHQLQPARRALAKLQGLEA